MPNWKKLIVSGSDANLNSLDVTQNISAFSITASAFSGSLEGTASIANKVTGGGLRYIPLWTGSTSNELTASIMYQTTKGIFIGYETSSHFHSAEGETLALHSGNTGVKNVLYAHGASNDSYRVNIRNISTGVSASTNFIATTDNGNDLGGYLRMGINSSTYTRTDEIGNALDAYLYSTGSDLLIGTLSPDKRIILFTGPGNATNNARVYIDSSGSVAINTSTTDPTNPEALLVTAIANSYNLIKGNANLDNYSQLNITNLSGGNSASADVVATNNIGTETSYYIDMGINSDQYNQPGLIGGPNDAYLYSTGRMLHIGNTTPGEHLTFFVGGFDVEANEKFVLEPEKPHKMIGDFDITGSVKIINNLTVGGTLVAEKFITEYVTSSVIYESGSTKFGDTSDDLHQFTGSLSVLGTISGSLILPTGLVSSSTQAANWTVLSASYAPTILPNGLFSSSLQVDYTQIQNTPTTIPTASYVDFGNIANKPALVSSSQQINTGSFSGSITTASFATTASAATSITFTPATASFATTSSFSQTSSFTVSSSFATTASAATSITFTPATASFATTASFAQNARLLNNTSSAVFATTGSNSFSGTQTITGSLLLTTDIVVFSGSFTTSGSFAVSGSLGVTAGITGSLLGSSSFATTASAATSITFTPSSASFSTTSSFATTASAATSITFIPSSASFATTASAANSITFTPTSASFATTASAANSITFIPSSASFATTASAATSITFIPSSASFATTASAATSITFTPTSASFATTSSYAVTSSFALSASFIDGGFY